MSMHKTPMKELKEIFSFLEPFEKAWSNETGAEVTRFPTGFTITYYEMDRVTSSVFIPDAE